MSFNPKIHHRRSIRLPDYDYTSAGAYFITICASGKECLFGAVENGQIRLNDAERIAAQCWRDIPLHFPHAALDEFVVMPNHVHGIIMIDDGKVDTVVRVKLHEGPDRTYRRFSVRGHRGHVKSLAEKMGHSFLRKALYGHKNRMG